MDRTGWAWTGKMWIHWAAWTWMAVVFDGKPPAALAPADPIKTLPLLIFEGVPDVDHRDEKLVRVPRILRLLIAMAWSSEAVPNTAAKHLGVLI